MILRIVAAAVLAQFFSQLHRHVGELRSLQNHEFVPIGGVTAKKRLPREPL
jgi:hypothetical protein